jgi:hypothetical protein
LPISWELNRFSGESVSEKSGIVFDSPGLLIPGIMLGKTPHDFAILGIN